MLSLKTLGGLCLQGTPCAYRAVHGLLLLCYLADQGVHKREKLAELLWPQARNTKNRKNNLSAALKRLHEAIDGVVLLQPSLNDDPYDPSLELNPNYLAKSPADCSGILKVDFLLCEQACHDQDLSTLRRYYHGTFLEGLEKRAPKLSEALWEWIEDKRTMLASSVLETCLAVLKHPDSAAQRSDAQALLETLSTHDPETFIASSLLADAYPYLPMARQRQVDKRLLETFHQNPETQQTLSLLQALALQHSPDWEIACQAQLEPLSEAQKVQQRQVLDDGDWLQSDGQRLRLRGQFFWRRHVASQAQYCFGLLRRLWQETPLLPEKLEELFHLAWLYHQGMAQYQQHLEQQRAAKQHIAEQLGLSANQDSDASDEVSSQTNNAGETAWQGMGDLQGFAWDKLCAAFLAHVQQASRAEHFHEVQHICAVWEREQQQRLEAVNPLLYWYQAYSLERQGEYAAARACLQPFAQHSDRYRALWATLLLRTGDTDAAIGLAEALLARSEDAWAQAEAHGLLAKVAYYREDYSQGIDHYEQARSCWQHADEACRAIGARASVASCYDYRAQPGDAARANHIYQELREAIQRQGLPLLTALRIRLNQVLLWDYHQLMLLEDVRQGFEDIISTLQQHDLSRELLGKAWHNFGEHYRRCYEQRPQRSPNSPELYHARDCYQQALEQLRDSRDPITFACASGDLGDIYSIQGDHAQARALLQQAVTVLQHNDQQAYLDEYHQRLSQLPPAPAEPSAQLPATLADTTS